MYFILMLLGDLSSMAFFLKHPFKSEFNKLIKKKQEHLLKLYNNKLMFRNRQLKVVKRFYDRRKQKKIK